MDKNRFSATTRFKKLELLNIFRDLQSNSLVDLRSRLVTEICHQTQARCIYITNAKALIRECSET